MTKKVIDCFIFYNELDLLNYRLNLLDRIVDYFILVESTHSFTGREKPLFFLLNQDMFSKFKDKIIHIVVEDLPHKYPDIDFEQREQWINEYFQRNAISRGIEKLNSMVQLNKDDLFIITDLDEIPDIRTISDIKDGNIKIGAQGISMLEMVSYYYNLTTMANDIFGVSKIITYGAFESFKMTTSIQNIRDDYSYPSIKNGGWHLSYFGSIDFIQNKILNFSHQEFDTEFITDSDKIEKCIKNKKYLFKDIQLLSIDICDNKYLPMEYDKYLKKFI